MTPRLGDVGTPLTAAGQRSAAALRITLPFPETAVCTSPKSTGLAAPTPALRRRPRRDALSPGRVTREGGLCASEQTSITSGDETAPASYATLLRVLQRERSPGRRPRSGEPPVLPTR